MSLIKEKINKSLIVLYLILRQSIQCEKKKSKEVTLKKSPISEELGMSQY